MLYNYHDLSLIKDEIEFVDTAILPLIDIDMTEKRQENANNIELIQHVLFLLEKQLKGRLLITPLFSIVNDDTTNVFSYVEQLKSFGFKHVIVISTKQRELEELKQVKLNSIPLEDMDQDIIQSLVKEEMTKVLKEIIQIWNS